MDTSTDGEWIRVEDALSFLEMSHADAIESICSRAYNGLIEAKAKQYIDGTGRRFGNVELPSEFGGAPVKSTEIGGLAIWRRPRPIPPLVFKRSTSRFVVQTSS